MRIIHTDDHAFLRAREGQYYLRGGRRRLWLMDDLQSFTPLRFTAHVRCSSAGSITG